MAKRGRPTKASPLAAQFAALREELENQVGGSVASSGRVPDIMEFIESPDYLGLSHYEPTPIELFPFQKIALKAFYRGTKGNENLRLTDEEIQLCKDHGLDDPDFEQGDLLKKYESGNLFQELVLVWGRRSGKDFVISILALYEAMRLIETPGGDPHALYGLSTGAPFTIITIAWLLLSSKIVTRLIFAFADEEPEKVSTIVVLSLAVTGLPLVILWTYYLHLVES
jgi:hypothetical protein